VNRPRGSQYGTSKKSKKTEVNTEFNAARITRLITNPPVLSVATCQTVVKITCCLEGNQLPIVLLIFGASAAK